MVVVVLTTVFTSCKGGLTPDLDTTKLYPAYSTALEKYGYINQSGEWIIQPLYDGVSAFSCGYAQVDMAGTNYFINKKGDLQNAMPVDYADDFYYNYCVVMLNDNLGMFDKNFQLAVPCLYADLGEMTEDGLAYATMDGKSYGFVDKKNNFVIFPQYEAVRSFVDGVAVILNGDKYGAVNTSGKSVIMPIYDRLRSLGNKRLGVYDENSNKWGMLTTSGEIKVQYQYDVISYFTDNNLAMASLDGENFGYIDANGSPKIMFQYKQASSFWGGYAWVAMGNMWMVIDTKANVKSYLAKDWAPATSFHNGLALVTDGNGEYRYVTPEGTVIFTWNMGGNKNTSKRSVRVSETANEEQIRMGSLAED